MTTIYLLLFVLLPQQSDWPQWGGSNRNFKVDMSIEDIDKAQPLKEVWITKVGVGYSGVVADSDLVVFMDRRGDVESICALELSTGKEVWRSSYDAPALEMMIPRYGFGPHSTPCISNGIVCSVGGTGIIRGTELETGKTKWTRQLWNEFDATKLERGYSASPVYFNKTFILPVGGKGTGIVAFAADTGKEVWRSTDCESAYATPVITALAGQKQLICLMAESLVSLNPSNGEALWKYDYQPTNTVHVASPITLSDDRVFVQSSNLATMLRVARNQNGSPLAVKKLWASRQMTFQVGNTIQMDDQLIGPSSTTSSAVLTSISVDDGRRLWRNRISGIGFLYKTNDGFIAIKDDGKITMNKLINGQAITLATADVKLSGRIWNTAAFAGKTMLIRDANYMYAFRFQTEETEAE